MLYLAGIDGGASKTHCIIGDLQGRILAEGFSTGSNYQVQGEEAARTAIQAALNQAMGELGIELMDIAYIVLGLAGADMESDHRVLDRLCSTFLMEGKYKILNDTWIGLRANIDDNCGVVSICGTGAACAGRNKAGKEVILRNLDYEMGNYGGGGEVARMALHYAFRSEELTDRYTRLEKEIPGLFGVENLEQVVLELRDPDFSERRLYEIPILVGRLALQGDVVCQEILIKMGQEIGKIAGGVIKKLGMEQENFKITLVGSIFRSKCPLLLDEYTTTVHRTAPFAHISIGEQKPVLGAYYMAIEEAKKYNVTNK